MRIGLTGGVAAGKSTVSAMLRELGAYVVDADQVAREIVEHGSEALREIAAAFGPEVITPQGALDRPAMAAIVFHDPEQLRRLEAITHPRIAARIDELVAAAPPEALVVLDHPLLVETGQDRGLDAVIVVDVPEELQIERMMRDRQLSESDARARIAAQASRERRLAAATVVIENTGDFEGLRRRVTEAFELLLAADSERD